MVEGGLVEGELVEGIIVDGSLVEGLIVDGGIVEGGLVDGGLVDGGVVVEILQSVLEGLKLYSEIKLSCPQIEELKDWIALRIPRQFKPKTALG